MLETKRRAPCSHPLKTRWSADDERLTYWALRPLASWTRLGEERTFTWVLPPLGTRFRRPEETVTRVLPLWYDSTQEGREGAAGTSQFFALPGVYRSRDARGREKTAWSFFYGDVDKFLGFDRAQWILFPLFLRLERGDRTSWNVLFPFLQWSTGEGGFAWRVWPLAGDQHWRGRYRRRFLLWPFIIWQEEDLDARSGPRWTAQLWLRNAFDERYAVRGFFFGNEPPLFPPTLYIRQGDPRHFGITLDRRF